MIEAEATGNQKCWYVVDLRDGTVVARGLRRSEAGAQGMYPFGYCRDGFKLKPCPGMAHHNAHVDNCSLCAPRWGWIMVRA